MTEDFSSLLDQELKNFDAHDEWIQFRSQTQETRDDLLAVGRWLIGRQEETDGLERLYLDDDPVVILAAAAGEFATDGRGTYILVPTDVPERLRRLREILGPTRVIALLAVAMVTVDVIEP